MSLVIPDNAPRPRLCHVKKWPNFQGYGFNLHAEKGKVRDLDALGHAALLTADQMYFKPVSPTVTDRHVMQVRSGEKLNMFDILIG